VPTESNLQLSVTVFLHHQEEYLFVLRNSTKKVDANRLNGVGGKVELGENFLQTALRETREETGYQVTAEQMRFAGLAVLRGGYPQNWLAAFFTASVDSKQIPIGNQNHEGKLLWIHQDELLSSPYELVDDLHYLWPIIIAQKEELFFTANLNEQEKVVDYSLNLLPLSKTASKTT
jgi:8-oxo-dGTP pyrophosphatase MutT (NUDIX family)